MCMAAWYGIYLCEGQSPTRTGSVVEGAVTISLPSDVQSIIAAKVASGEFSSESEVVAAGVRLLLDEEQQRAQQTDRLRGMIQEAVDEFERGEFKDMDEAFDEVEIELFGKRLADE